MRRLLPLVASLALTATASFAEIIERVVVKVNGEIVTLTDFQTRQVRAVQQARVGSDKVPEYLRLNNARLLQEAIDDLVLKQRAEELGLRIPAQYITEAVEEIKKDNSIESDERFIELLQREGMTLEDLKREIEVPMLRRGVLQRDLESKISATDAEMRAEYEKNKEKYARPASITLHEIFVRGTPAASEAQALAERARNGEDFAALAREFSAASTKEQGGLIGKISRGELNPDLEKAAFALPVGGVSDPVRSSDGWRILRVSEKTEAGYREFEAARAEIRNRLETERFTKEYDAHLAELRKNAVIDIRIREVPLQIDETGRLVEAPVLGTAVRQLGEGGDSRPASAPSVGLDDEITTSGSAKPEVTSPAAAPAAANDEKTTKPQPVAPAAPPQ